MTYREIHCLRPIHPLGPDVHREMSDVLPSRTALGQKTLDVRGAVPPPTSEAGRVERKIARRGTSHELHSSVVQLGSAAKQLEAEDGAGESE